MSDLSLLTEDQVGLLRSFTLELRNDLLNVAEKMKTNMYGTTDDAVEAARLGDTRESVLLQIKSSREQLPHASETSIAVDALHVLERALMEGEWPVMWAAINPNATDRSDLIYYKGTREGGW